MLLSYPVYRAIRVCAAAAALTFCLPTPAGAQIAVKDSRIGELQAWVAAVEKHEPGVADTPVTEFAKLTPARRALLLQLAVPFSVYLRDDAKVPARLRGAELAVITSLAQRIAPPMRASGWWHRAVMFETDVAILAPELTAQAMRNASGPGLTEGIHAEDGELGERNLLNWHFQLARDLVAARDPATPDAFGAAWYHAVALHLLEHMLLGELDPHMQQGFIAFPEDARIRFDDACLADAFGAARVQAVLVGMKNTTFRPRIPSVDRTIESAQRLFAQAIALDMNFAEPRVRLARLQQLDGKNADALALIGTAFRQPMSPEIEYMAHLVAGRANAALSNTEAGAAEFNAALKLFPSSQTPWIGLSHLYLQAGDLEQAAAAAARLTPQLPFAGRDDPWWSYFQAPWLTPGELLDKLRDGVRR